MEVVDAQVHISRADHPHPAPTIDAMRSAMADLRIDAALVTARTRFDVDNGYLIEAVTRYPTTFAAVGFVDPNALDLDAQMRAWRAQPGAVGIRTVLRTSEIPAWDAGAYRPLLEAAQRYAMPICVYPPGHLTEFAAGVRAFPDLQFVVDHLGLYRPRNERDVPFHGLANLLALAEYPNVAVKISAIPTLSRERFPFADLWPSLHKVISSFGLHRVMWGSDWTTMTSCSYAENVACVRETRELSQSDKALLLGQTARTIFGWHGAQTQTTP